MAEPKFGLAFPPGPPSEVQELAIMAEDLGFDSLGLSDSQSLFRETYVALSAAAAVTRTLTLGPRVSNPVTRHPAVTASAMATLHELSRGRAFLGMGTGDSALLNLGLRPARLQPFEAYVTAVQSLFRDGSARYGGNDIALQWGPEAGAAAIPVQIAAEGPKTLRLAGRLGDAVLVGMGLSPEIVEHATGLVAEGAREAGRDAGDVELWWMTKANLSSDVETSHRQLRMALAASAHHAFRFTVDGKLVPEALAPAVAQLEREYRFSEHEAHDRTHNAELVDRLGLTGYLADRFAIAGSVGDWIARLEGLIESGARNFWLTAHMADKRAFVRTVGEQVLPRLRGS